MDEIINNAEEFYQSLGVAYRIVSIVSGSKVYCVCMHVHVHVRLCVYTSIHTHCTIVWSNVLRFRGG